MPNSASGVNPPHCGAVQGFNCPSESSRLESIYLWAETISRFVNNHAVGMNRYGNNVFLHLDCVLVFSLAVEELSQPRHLVINNLPLCFQLGFKDHESILIADQRNWPLAERIDVNAESVPKV